MPIVPKFEPKVQEQALPGVRLSADAPLSAFGGGEAVAGAQKAAQNLGDLTMRFAMEEKKKADDLATQKAYADLVRSAQNLFYDPKEGALARRGQAAMGAVDEFGKKFDDTASKIEETLSNDDQKNIFRKMRLRERTEFDGNLQRHTFQEIQKFDDETTESGLAVQRDKAVLNYQSPGAVASALSLQKALIQSHAERTGKPVEWIAEKTREVESGTHTAILNRMLSNGQDMAAKGYFEQVRGALNARDVVAAEKAVHEGVTRGESQRQATEIMRTTGGNLRSALDVARKIEDADVQAATVNEIKIRHGENEKIKQEYEENRFKSAANAVEATKQRPAEMVWNQLSLQERNALDNRIEQLRKGISPETDWDNYYTLKTMASSSSTRDEFLKTNLMVYRPVMANAEFKELIDLQTGLRKGDEKAEKVLDGFRSDNQIVNDTLAAAGIDPTPKPGTPAAQKVNLFRSKVDEQVRAVQQKSGKKATNEELQSIADNLITEGITKKGWFWDQKKRVFELAPGEKVEFSIKDVPRAERAKIEDALRRRNIPVSDEKILELYSRKQGLNASH